MYIFVKIIRVLTVRKIKKCYIKINLLGFNIEIRNDLCSFLFFIIFYGWNFCIYFLTNEIYYYIFTYIIKVGFDLLWDYLDNKCIKYIVSS